MVADNSAGRLKLAVVTYPGVGSDGPSLAKDVELVRASILYADEVELISLGAVMIASVVELAAGDESNLVDLLIALDDETMRHLGGGELPAGWREILPVAAATMRLDPTLLRALPGGHEIDPSFFETQQDWQRMVGETMQGLRETAENILVRSGGADLVPAFNAGILKLSPSGLADDGDSDKTVAGYVQILKQLLEDPSTRLLFDDDAGSLARSLVDQGQVEPNRLALRHAGQAAVGSGLVARLPAFPEAPLDELLDLRSDLTGPLMRYRRAVVELADRLSFRAFDSESSAEIDDLWTTDVAPALDEIKEGLAEHKLVRELQRTLGADLKTLLGAGAALYIGLGTFASVNEWIASAVSVVGPSAEAAEKAATARRSARADLQGRDLFYLYEVHQRLG